MSGFAVVVGLCIIGLLAVVLLYRESLLRTWKICVLSVFLALAAMLIRGLLFGFESNDYIYFLSDWMQHFREHGIVGLRYPVGNYHAPYLYFLSLFSYLPVRDLYLIKLLSVLFDVILAFYVMRLAGLFTESDRLKLTAFFGILFLPTLVLNGAMWGQCDSIFTAFAVASVYYALTKRPYLSVVMIALSFAFKLQAIFLMPLFFIFLVKKVMRIRHLLVFVPTYLAAVLPAILLGRAPIETIFFYFYQVETVGRHLTNNAPSIFMLTVPFNLNNTVPSWLIYSGISVTFSLIFGFYAVTCRPRFVLTQERVLIGAFLFALGMPFFLPHMHERYFIIGEVFAVALAVADRKKLILVPLTQFATLLGYHFYFSDALERVIPLQWGMLAMGLSLLIAARGMRKSNSPDVRERT